MFERFTERARQVVVLSHEEARKDGHGHIGAGHILLGLLREEEGLAARALRNLDVNLEGVREGVKARTIGRLRDDQELEGQIPFTPRAKNVFDLSLREALSLGHNYVGTEHILLGLTRDDGVAAEILKDDFLLSAETIRNEVVRMLSGPKAPILKKDAESRPAHPFMGGEETIKHPAAAEQDLKDDSLLILTVKLARMLPGVSEETIIKHARGLANA